MTTQTFIAPTAHSHSRLQAYSSCPLSYRLSFIDKVGTDDSDALEIGSAAHEFFDRWVTQFKNADNKEVAVMALAATCFQKEPRKQSNFKDYLEICQTFAAAYKPDPDYPVALSELQVAVDRNWQSCGWFDKSVMFRAKIDRIDLPQDAAADKVTKIRIVDYKSGFSGEIDSFQLDQYALLASILYPSLEQAEVEFYYVRSGYKQVKLLEVKDLGVTKVQLEALMARVEGDSKFKAKPGARCLNCHVAAFCDQKPSTLISISKPEDAEKLGEEIAFLDAQSKAKKKSLKAWVEQKGAVEAGGLKYDNWPTSSYKVEIAPLLSICVKFEVDPAIVLNPDTTALKKLFKKNPAFAEAVAPYSAVETSMRFLGKKAKGEDD
jgi:CRISPR/Cas system-associated exonuclease Cas4 (RecB family)